MVDVPVTGSRVSHFVCLQALLLMSFLGGLVSARRRSATSFTHLF